MSFHNERDVKRTRKSCRCRWCHEIIEKGQPSVVATGVYEGDFYSTRWHPECNEAFHRWWKKYGQHEDEFPYDPMNRGGIEPYGEPEGGDQ